MIYRKLMFFIVVVLIELNFGEEIFFFLEEEFGFVSDDNV